MKQLVSLVLLLAGMHPFIEAQSITISGRVNDTAGLPVEAATVSLLHAADSSLVKMELSDATGRFEFSDLKAGHFLVVVTAMGYEKTFGSSIEAPATSPGIELPPITLASNAINLNTVTVTAKSPSLSDAATAPSSMWKAVFWLPAAQHWIFWSVRRA